MFCIYTLVTPSLTHSLTLTHSLAHLFTHSLTHTYWLLPNINNILVKWTRSKNKWWIRFLVNNVDPIRQMGGWFLHKRVSEWVSEWVSGWRSYLVTVILMTLYSRQCRGSWYMVNTTSFISKWVSEWVNERQVNKWVSELPCCIDAVIRYSFCFLSMYHLHRQTPPPVDIVLTYASK